MRTNIFSKALKSFAFLLLFVGFSSSFAQVPTPVAWVATSGGNIPATAVAAGKEANGQALFLCRAKYGPDNGVHPGKTRREFNGCNIGWGGREVAVAQYEVAVSLPAGATWQPTTGANIPATAIIGGQEAAGVLAICRANHQGGVHMGKTRAAFNGCNIGWGGSEVAIPQYEVLVMAPQAIAPLPSPPAPAPAPAPGVAAGWTQMPGAAVDIGAAGAGQVWVTNKGQNIYRWVNNNWTQMPGAAVRVAVDPSGNAWVVNAGGGIYHWENNNWKQIPGALTDIGVGGPTPNGTVWGVNAGQEIFRLNGSSWEKMPGAAVRVAVDPAGNAWVVNSGGGIYTWVNNNWVQRPGAAKDVAVCSTGAVYVIGTDNAPYKWNGTNNWDKQPGGPLLNIACDGTGRLFATTPTEQIITAGPVATPVAAAPAPSPVVAAAVPFMGCQQMSNSLGTNHGVTWGSANTLQQQQWQANGCNTRPQADAPVPAPATGAAAQAKAIADAAADAQAKAKALADAAAAARDISWTLMPGSLSDIGVGGGMLWGVDSGGKIFRLTGSTWTLMPAATVGVARRVSVDSQGNSWVVNAEGDIFTWNGSAFVKKVGDRLDGNNLKMPFSDIGVGPNGAVWAVAKVDKRNNPGEVNGSWVKLTGTAWGQGIGGEPKSVSVDPQGAAWTVDAQGYIGKWDGSKSDRNSANARAIDVAACPNGDVFIVGTDKAPYKWNGSSWDKKTGANLMNIACDAQGKVYATSTTQQVFVGVMAASASAAAALEKALADAAQAKALADAAAAAQAKAMADAAAAAQAKAKADAAQNKAWDDEAAAAGAKALAAQAAANAARAKLQAQANATAPVAAPELPCGSGQVRQNGVCVSLAAAQLSISAGNAGICTKNQTAYLANEEKVANNKSNEIQAKIKAVEDEKMSRDKQTNIDYAPNPKFDWSANIAQANQLRLVLANNQQGAQDKIRALTNEQIAWTALHKTKVENWLKDSRYDKSICP